MALTIERIQQGLQVGYVMIAIAAFGLLIEVERDMKPMLDIVFSISLIFVLTASWPTKTGAYVGRPTATTDVSKEHGNILVWITANNETRIDKSQVESHVVRVSAIQLQAVHTREQL